MDFVIGRAQLCEEEVRCASAFEETFTLAITRTLRHSLRVAIRHFRKSVVLLLLESPWQLHCWSWKSKSKFHENSMGKVFCKAISYFSQMKELVAAWRSLENLRNEIRFNFRNSLRHETFSFYTKEPTAEEHIKTSFREDDERSNTFEKRKVCRAALRKSRNIYRGTPSTAEISL